MTELEPRRGLQRVLLVLCLIGIPATLARVLAEAAALRPEARDLLLVGELPRPTVYRDGERLTANDFVHAGDRLELVLALAGG